MCIPVQVLFSLAVVGALPYTVERRALSQPDIVPSGVGEERSPEPESSFASAASVRSSITGSSSVSGQSAVKWRS